MAYNFSVNRGFSPQHSRRRVQSTISPVLLGYPANGNSTGMADDHVDLWLDCDKNSSAKLVYSTLSF